ncbi:putative Glycoside Hydrolase Family 18 [Aspergillus affinis]|uniref:putative Glycoside Hydrolase Family 18 n=1 Tax=Aspergillus affinis TaxID=1070780 RepID=UPI0022FEABE7|nr:putative Glycoside Hydrolase Family 18 [Aspergillus affinis]KAI9034937.1 putative Glycoside Hydrolase Family 18 [Aspergillus affinis]
MTGYDSCELGFLSVLSIPPLEQVQPVRYQQRLLHRIRVANRRTRNISPSYAVNASPIQAQWELFKQLPGFKKILSLGDWSFSAEPATYHIFRSAVEPGNQDIVVANIVSFVTEHDLNGIDIEWKYPAATDIPSIPPGT